MAESNGHGGVRPGAGRKSVKSKKTETQAIAALFEVAIGQSSVKLAIDSKNQVKPEVHVFHKDVGEAAKLAETEFDRLLIKYSGQPSTT